MFGVISRLSLSPSLHVLLCCFTPANSKYSYSVFALFLRQQHAPLSLRLPSRCLQQAVIVPLFHLIFFIPSPGTSLSELVRRALPRLNFSSPGRWRWMSMPGRSPPQSAAHAEGLIKRAGTSALMQPHHPQAERGDDKHRGHNFTGSRAGLRPV